MKTKKSSRVDQEWQIRLGKHIEKLIKERGYSSVYDFWVECAGEKFSRAGIEYLVRGARDPKISTLRVLAQLLKMPISGIVDFED